MINKNFVISIIIGIVIFVIGGGVGIMYQQQKATPESQIGQNNFVLSQIRSKTISLITAAGEVTKIEGRNITLTSGGDSLTVKIRDDAQINSIVAPKEGDIAAQNKIEFRDIKKGDDLDVSIKFLPEGQIESNWVLLILPQAK